MSPRNKNLKEKRQYWKSHILKWQDSGQTQIEYCRENELNERVFGYWKRKLVVSEENNTFIEIPVPKRAVPSGGIIELAIPNGIILRCGEDIRINNLEKILRAIQD